MDYDEIRSRIKSGDVIAVSHYKWASFYDLQIQAVRMFTRSEYSHVAIAWVVGDRVFLIESVIPYIRITPLSNFAREGFYWIPTETEMSAEELSFALSKVGVGKYSKWQAIKGFLKNLSIGTDNIWQCAEFVIAARKRSGLDLGRKATPSAVVAELQKQGNPTYFVN